MLLQDQSSETRMAPMPSVSRCILIRRHLVTGSQMKALRCDKKSSVGLGRLTNGLSDFWGRLDDRNPATT